MTDDAYSGHARREQAQAEIEGAHAMLESVSLRLRGAFNRLAYTDGGETEDESFTEEMDARARLILNTLVAISDRLTEFAVYFNPSIVGNPDEETR